MVGFGPLGADTVAALLLNVGRWAGSAGCSVPVTRGRERHACGSHSITVSY